MNDRENWYKTFFNGLALEMWHNAVPQAYTENEVQFIKDTSALKPGDKIIDVPCGSGRHTLALAKEGFSVTGIDIAQGNIKMLDDLKGKLPVKAICANILEYAFDEKFDLAICLGNSFSYFPYDTMVQFVQKIARALNAGAKFIINSGAIAESILPNIKETREMEIQDILFRITNAYGTENSVLKTTMQFTKGDLAETKTSYHFIFTIAEVKRMLAQGGFAKVQVFGGIDRSAYKLGDGQAYIIAEK